MSIFARFLSFSRFLGPKNHENPYFYKISKITFFWHPMRMVYIWIYSLFGSKLRICINFYQNSGWKLPLFLLYKDLPIFCETLITLTGRHFAKKSGFFNSVKRFDQSIDWSLIIKSKSYFWPYTPPSPPPPFPLIKSKLLKTWN